MKDPKRDGDPERIREVLARVTPKDPGVSARAAKVAARARRQRTRHGTAGVLAVAATAAVVVMTPHLLTSIRTQNIGPDTNVGASSSPGDGRRVDPFATTPCPATPYDLGTAAADQQTTDGIRGDVQSIRLCAATVDGGTDRPWLPPRDALELALDDFLASVRQLPEADPDRCAAIRVAPDPYTFVVAYPDGSVETVAVSNQCSDLTVTGRRVASGDVLVAFQDALAQQRQRLQPEQLTALGIGCLDNVPGPDPRVPLTRGARPDAETRFTAFLACVSGDPGVAEPAAVQLLNDEWPTAIRDLNTRPAKQVDRCPAAGVIAPPTYGVTTWGDVIGFSFRRCGNYFVSGYSGPDAPDEGGVESVQFLPSNKLADALRLP